MFDDIIFENVKNILLANYKLITYDSGLFFEISEKNKLLFLEVLR